MSKRHRCKNCCCNCKYRQYASGYSSGGFQNIYNLIILILIILKFCTRKGVHEDRSNYEDNSSGREIIDRSILFIITLFLLLYCSCSIRSFS